METFFSIDMLRVLFDVLAWNACDHERRRRVVDENIGSGTNVKQYAMMRAKQDEQHQKLHRIIENENRS